MNFFEAQARARRRSGRLLVLFALAVAGTLAGLYAAAVALRTALARGAPVPLWDPRFFVAVAGVTLLVIGLASLIKWLQFQAGGRAVAESLGARRVDAGTRDLAERRLLNVVEEMAIASGVPLPAVYVLDEEEGINAFAAGLTPSDAVVAVTRGTLSRLSRDELQGVVAHEFSHILNGDMRLNMRLTATVFGILVIGLAGRGILSGLRHVRVRGDARKGSAGVIAAIAGTGLLLLIVGYIGYFFGRLLQAAVSRQREFLADASAVQFTRNPSGLAGALRRIRDHAAGSRLAHGRSAELGHFFFSQGFRSSFGGLWATHPPLDERIRAVDPRGEAEAGSREVSEAPPSPTAAGFVASLGSPDAGAIARARRVREAIPGPLHAAAGNPADAEALIYALVLPPGSARLPGADPCEGFPTDLQARIRALQGDLPSLPAEGRLPLLQLTLPALRLLGPEGTARLLSHVERLTLADGEVTPFEYALGRVIRREIAQARTPGAFPRGTVPLTDLAPEASLALTALARVASSDDAGARRAFSAATAPLTAIRGLAYLESAAVDIPALDAALDRLADALPESKAALMSAAARVVLEDRVVSSTEAELLRAFGAALGVPVPPLALPA